MDKELIFHFPDGTVIKGYCNINKVAEFVTANFKGVDIELVFYWVNGSIVKGLVIASELENANEEAIEPRDYVPFSNAVVEWTEIINDPTNELRKYRWFDVNWKHEPFKIVRADTGEVVWENGESAPGYFKTRKEKHESEK